MQELEQCMQTLGSNPLCCCQHHRQLCTTDSIIVSVTELSVFQNQAFTVTRFNAFKDVKYYNIKKNNCIVA